MNYLVVSTYMLQHATTTQRLNTNTQCIIILYTIIILQSSKNTVKPVLHKIICKINVYLYFF